MHGSEFGLGFRIHALVKAANDPGWHITLEILPKHAWITSGTWVVLYGRALLHVPLGSTDASLATTKAGRQQVFT